RGYSLLQVAGHLGVTKQAVSLYENARCRPSFDVLQRLVKLLRVPPHHFARPPLHTHSGPTFYRSLASATVSSRNVAEQKLKWLREVTAYVGTRVEFPVVKLPTCDLPPDPFKIRQDDIERTAIALRRYWALGDGVISNVVSLLEYNGIVVSRFPIDTDKIDGFSAVDDDTGRPFVVLAADKCNLFRSRTDAAHELGHIVMHRNVPKQVLGNAAAFKAMEEQAFEFAGAFLLPAATFGREYFTTSLDSFLSVKLKWKAAIAAMIMRASRLGMISESQTKTLWVQRSRRGWNRSEPYDGDCEAESPQVLRRALEMIVGSGVGGTRAGVLADLSLDGSDVEMLAGAEGLFEADESVESVPPAVLKFQRPAG
ncbi:MAG: XRE family transcriptional regulator, partial [Fimbriiglobus sp.]